MRKITYTHIKLHCDARQLQAIMNIVHTRVKTMNGMIIVKTFRKDTKYLTKVSGRFFDIEETIDAIKELKQSSHTKRYNVDYDVYLNIMEKVKQDRIKYGDVVPGTTDESLEDEYNQTMKDKHIPKTRHNGMTAREKQIARDRFRLKFLGFNWDKHLKHYEGYGL